MQSALDALGLAVWIVDVRGRLDYCNPAAQLAQAERAGLDVVDGVLRALRPEIQPALRRAFEQAAGGVRTLLLPGGEEGRPVVVAPLGSDAVPGHLLVLQGGASAVEASTLALYTRSLGITPCEGEVLAALCEGHAVGQIARQRQVKVSTVRAQIGSLRDKTGLRKVSQLLSALAALPPLGPRLSAAPARAQTPQPERPRSALVVPSALGPMPQAPQRGDLLRPGLGQRIARVA